MFTHRVRHTDYSYPCRRAALTHAHLCIWLTEEPLSRSDSEYAKGTDESAPFTYPCLPRYQLMFLLAQILIRPRNTNIYYRNSRDWRFETRRFFAVGTVLKSPHSL